ncbi:hypothetical protein AC579_2205 [Pseudocercospora musae]|uniref:Uncharacterized protein n=1 Tax=Pseudocercospora musae TaxID=113226 RepID=A0A139IKS2_9PEZI|nr:hypothetical protein AC579_2205 [Pseudocercospora musae]
MGLIREGVLQSLTFVYPAGGKVLLSGGYAAPRLSDGYPLLGCGGSICILSTGILSLDDVGKPYGPSTDGESPSRRLCDILPALDACSDAWPDGRIIAQISLDVGRNDMAVDTFTGDEPLARYFLRHDGHTDGLFPDGGTHRTTEGNAGTKWRVEGGGWRVEGEGRGRDGRGVRGKDSRRHCEELLGGWLSAEDETGGEASSVSARRE